MKQALNALSLDNARGLLDSAIQRLAEAQLRWGCTAHQAHQSVAVTPATRTPRTAARGIRSTTRRAGNKSVASSSGDPDSEGEPPHAAPSHPCRIALTRLRSFACLVFAAHQQHIPPNRRIPSQPAAQSAAGLLSFPQFTQRACSPHPLAVAQRNADHAAGQWHSILKALGVVSAQCPQGGSPHAYWLCAVPILYGRQKREQICPSRGRLRKRKIKHVKPVALLTFWGWIR